MMLPSCSSISTGFSGPEDEMMPEPCDSNEWYGPDALSAAIGDPERSLNARLAKLWCRLNKEHGFAGLHRMAIAVYEPETDELITFAASGDSPSPLSRYKARLSDSASLDCLSREGGIRIVHELQHIPPARQHTAKVAESGFRSSLTVPIRYQGKLYGFVFFNSRVPAYFQDATLDALLPYARLVGMLGAHAIREARVIRGTVGSTIALSRARDVETSGHMERIGELSRAIATRLAPEAGFSDEYIKLLEQFAPLHDLGKLAIPDAILLKPGPLTEEEFAHMRRHVDSGLELLESMTRELDISDDGQMALLREVIAYHHERLDGSGYPYGVQDEEIPWGGRIVAVADIFDALTSERPYKEAWSVERASEVLREEAGTKLCPRCVHALLDELHERSHATTRQP